MGTATRLVRSTLHVVITPAEDAPGQWVAHCLELDVVSQGNGPSHAVEMITEAIEMVVEDDLARGDDPLRARNRAPDECWAALLRVMKLGQPVKLDELSERRIGTLVVELTLCRPEHPAMNVSDRSSTVVQHMALAQFEEPHSIV